MLSDHWFLFLLLPPSFSVAVFSLHSNSIQIQPLSVSVSLHSHLKSNMSSRVTRSSSRQPERSPRRASTPSKSSSNKKAAPSSSAKKKSTGEGSSSRKQSPARASPASSKKSGDSPASSKKKSTVSKASDVAQKAVSSARKSVEKSVPEVTSSVSRVSRNVRQLADQVADDARREFNAVKGEIEKITSVGPPVNTTIRASRAREAVVNEQLPLIAVLPHVLVYGALVSLAHVLVLFSFSKVSLQQKLAVWLSSLTFGLQSSDSIQHALLVSDANHVAFWLVVPLYIAAGLLLQSGVRYVNGGRNNGGRTQAFAANIARVVSAVLFVLTVAAYTKWDQVNSYEGMNALFVLEFAFMLQEFLLGFSRFTMARNVYALLYLLLTGYKAVLAYQFRATATTSPQAPPIDVALSYALFVVNTSDNLAAVSGLFAAVNLPTLAGIWITLQSIVNFAVSFIFAVAIYQRHGALFPDVNEKKQPTFLESSAASFVMATLIFLLVVDSYFVPFNRCRVKSATATRTSKKSQ
jgi:hypothetical protein